MCTMHGLFRPACLARWHPPQVRNLLRGAQNADKIVEVIPQVRDERHAAWGWELGCGAHEAAVAIGVWQA